MKARSAGAHRTRGLFQNRTQIPILDREEAKNIKNITYNGFL